MSTLHDTLWSMTNDILSIRARLMDDKVKCTRKADYIDVIKRGYEGDGLLAIWHSLNDVERLAVAEASYAPQHLHDAARFEAKYGHKAVFSVVPKLPPGKHVTSQDEGKYATRLNLLLYPDVIYRGYSVPDDLALRLQSICPQPVADALRTITEPDPEASLVLRQTEHEALADVRTLLRLADQGMLKLSTTTGMPSATGVSKIIEHLAGGDWFPPEVASNTNLPKYGQKLGYIKPIAWALMLHTARLIGMAGTKSKLAPAGAKALAQPAHVAIRAIWDKWLDNRTHDEFNRIDPIKGQGSKGCMTAKQPRRDAIVEALTDCPVNQWVRMEEFSRYMRATDLEFEVTHDPWKLYISERQYGSLGYSDSHDWNILQFRYILCFLFEYAATLGLIDIAYVHPDGAKPDFSHLWGADHLSWLSRYDGLRAFRVTDLGAFCLGINDAYQPRKPDCSVTLSVLSDLTINVISGQLSQEEVLMLETWAEPVDTGIWRLNRERALDAVERGRSASEFASFLQERDDQPLPDAAETFCRASESNGTAVHSTGEAILFECRDAATAALLCRQKELARLCFLAGKTTIAVPTAHVPKFRKCARSLGLGVV